MNKVFLSHSSKQKPFVSAIAKKLGKNNIIYDEYTFEVANLATLMNDSAFETLLYKWRNRVGGIS